MALVVSRLVASGGLRRFFSKIKTSCGPLFLHTVSVQYIYSSSQSSSPLQHRNAMSLSLSSKNHSLTSPNIQPSKNVLFMEVGESQDETALENAVDDPIQQHPHTESIQLPKYFYVIPVLFMEFLALALTRAVIPPLLLYVYGNHVYLVMGLTECVRGILSFLSCPLFGKISDVMGRKICLFITVLGTLTPICVLAIMTFLDEQKSTISPLIESTLTQRRIWVFISLLSLSGIFSSTFTLTFAYISDTVAHRDQRLGAYGLALGTFGLSFTIGPMTGGYLARVEEAQDSRGYSNSSSTENIVETVLSTISHLDSNETVADLLPINNDSMTLPTNYIHLLGQKRVFTASLLLTLLDLAYIYFILPESNIRSRIIPREDPTNESLDDDCSSASQWDHIRRDVLPNAWKPLDTLKILSGDPLMYQVGIVALLYYTSLWAVVSTLILYAAKRFHLGPERLGELISVLGLCTMISEAVLVRLVVPTLGEKKSIRVGLAAFTVQCVVLALAYEGWQLFFCVLLSMVVNLVYPSLTSLVTSSVAPEMVGTALGAINGVKAFTEGLGPLLFGTLMTLSESSALPGWPYLIAAVVAYMAYSRASLLPDDDDEDYISEKYNRKWIGQKRNSSRTGSVFEMASILTPQERAPGDEEYIGLLSEVEEDSDERDITEKS